MSHRPATPHSPAAGRAGPAFAAARARAGAWWAARPPRERRLLGVGALVITLALTWALALQPALQSIAHSREQLPRLRADAVRVDALILEAQTLQRRQSGRIDAAALPEVLRADLRRAGLEAASALGAAPAAATDAGWEISLTDAGAPQVMDWLAGLPYRLHVRIHTVELARSRVDGRDRPGQVSGRIVVLPPERAP